MILVQRFTLAVLLVGASAAGAQDRVVLVDRGPGGAGPLLESVLAQPHRLVAPDSGWFRLRRNDNLSISLVILGRTTTIEGNVAGDVVVVGGDLFVRPGSRIGGRAVAIGGGVYPSALAIVEGGTLSFRDDTFLITRADGGYDLRYQSLREHVTPPLLFPGVYGLRMPTYDRVNGASVPFGPALTLPAGIEVHALATYRSDLGTIDPSLASSAQLTRRTRAQAWVGRGTFSNDNWIWSNLVNSFGTFTSGTDTRNHYRADRADLTLHRLWEWRTLQVEPLVGARYEKAWSVGPAMGELRGPWSILGRTDTLGMYRPNPAVDDGTLSSALAGVVMHYETDYLRARLRSLGEMGLETPGATNLFQLTSDLDVAFPAFGEHEYALEVHWMTTPGDSTPRQRYGYLGGSGTLPFLALLEQGGDEVLLIDQRYAIPVPSVRLGLLGEPTLIFRHRLGSAGVGGLPSFEHILGAGVLLTILRVEVQVDPERRQARFSAGFSFSR